MKLLQLLAQIFAPDAKMKLTNASALPSDRAFSAIQNCDVKVLAARSNDLDMVSPEQR